MEYLKKNDTEAVERAWGILKYYFKEDDDNKLMDYIKSDSVFFDYRGNEIKEKRGALLRFLNRNINRFESGKIQKISEISYILGMGEEYVRTYITHTWLWLPYASILATAIYRKMGFS